MSTTAASQSTTKPNTTAAERHSEAEKQMTKSTIRDVLAGVKDQKVEDDPDFVPTDNLPDRDTVVVPAMRAELQKLHLADLEEKQKAAAKAAAKKSGTAAASSNYYDNDAADTSNEEEHLDYFSSKNIAQCFWLTRKAEFQTTAVKRWFEEALFIFAHSRAFDYESAARRFFKFNAEAVVSEIVSLDEIPKDVAETISSSGLYYHAPQMDARGRPIVYASLKDFTFLDGYTVKQMKRMNMWLFWQWAVRFRPAPQVNGLMFVMSYTGMTMGCINQEYKKWTDRVMLEMLPLKLSSTVLAYPPFWVDSLLWPLIRLVMKQKLLDRIQWLGNDPEKVKAKYMVHAYNKPTGLFTSKPASLEKFCIAQKISPVPAQLVTGEEAAELQELMAVVPIEFGGTVDINPTTVRAQVEATWKVSEEAIPEGCYKVPPPVKK